MVVSAFCHNTTVGEVMIAHAKDSHGFLHMSNTLFGAT